MDKTLLHYFWLFFLKAKTVAKIKEIAIDCSNGERYFIDGVSINDELRNQLSLLSAQENITLLIHPNSNTIVEFSSDNAVLLDFNDTIDKLDGEATGFIFLGLFMYFCALVGLYYTVYLLLNYISIKVVALDTFIWVSNSFKSLSLRSVRYSIFFVIFK